MTHCPLSLSCCRTRGGHYMSELSWTAAIKDHDTHINIHTLNTSCGREWAHKHQLERAMVSGKRCEQGKWCVWVSVNMRECACVFVEFLQLWQLGWRSGGGVCDWRRCQQSKCLFIFITRKCVCVWIYAHEDYVHLCLCLLISIFMVI